MPGNAVSLGERHGLSLWRMNFLKMSGVNIAHGAAVGLEEIVLDSERKHEEEDCEFACRMQKTRTSNPYKSLKPLKSREMA